MKTGQATFLMKVGRLAPYLFKKVANPKKGGAKMIHRVAANIMDGLADAVTGFVNQVATTIKTPGEAVMKGLDKPFTEITGKEGPHRVVDIVADGAIDAGVNFINQGVVGSARKFGDAVMAALDQPLQQTGLGKIELPRIFKR